MGYIGKSPQTGAYSILDSLTASATASYTMQVDSVDFSPESVNHMLVSLNGVIQAPTTSYTISGSTITFASALTSSDSIDFIMVYGNVLDIGTPSDATVTNAKTNFVSTSSAAGLQIKGDGTTDGTLQLNCSQNSHGIKLKSPPHSASASYTLTFPNDDGTSGQALTTNGSGVLTWADAGGTNTPAFHVNFGNTSSTSVGHDTGTKMAFDSEDFDTDNAYDSSTNYRFTPQVAGKYFVYGQVSTARNSDDYNKYSNCEIRKNGTTVLTANENNSFYNSVATRGLIDMNGSSDYLECFYYHTFGTTISVDASNLYSYFGAFRIIT